MAEKTDVILIADGGDLTVGRHMPAYTYGSFDVTIPADKQQEQPAENRLRNGYIYRPPNAGAGAFDVGFVRADVTLNMNGKSSNLEAVVDAAQKRVDGNLFFERDITGRGLGAYEPGADFRLGDVVLVEIWGRRIKVPVTAIDLIGNSQEGARGWRVHVGGQMISDAEALKTHNDTIWARINQERAERLRTVGAAQKTATTAVTAAGVADIKANEAKTAVDEVARNLAAESKQRTVENLAMIATLARYYIATQPQTGYLRSKGTLIWQNAKIVHDGDITFSIRNQNDIGFTGVTAIMVVRMDAIAGYSDTYELKIDRDNPTTKLSTHFAEAVRSFTVTIYPQYSVHEILRDEIEKKGV